MQPIQGPRLGTTRMVPLALRIICLDGCHERYWLAGVVAGTLGQHHQRTGHGQKMVSSACSAPNVLIQVLGATARRLGRGDLALLAEDLLCGK